ncbi:tRNA/rRNA methyltransferase [Shewanella cyperi]|uniref:tRNA (cytidine/uridine-2'-O-)-methyltransferase TrmJ n=1 Tax=Shewanella cyperi TaxID=2814292 RepID=A0A974XQU4_9GAMM|nr:tRNA/rRNA methyltransferase [Shewanella cyperi]QSX31703.1 tRNA/rRNA methyltransferase [Shewanella cyperi]
MTQLHLPTLVLVEPARPANVGACARAMKTMGFTRLVLVNSQCHLQDEAQWVAHGATEILASARVVDSLAAIRPEFDLLVGTTARERGSPRHYLAPDELAQTLAAKASQKTALVFGRESSGLNNQELALCDLLSYVPQQCEYPSLNLGQATMLYCYALSDAQKRLGLQNTAAPAPQLQALKHKTQSLLDQLPLSANDKLTPWLMEGLSLLSDRDCRLAHQLVGDLLEKLKQNTQR